MEIKNYFAQDAQGNIMPSANCYLYLQGTTTLATGLVDGNGTPISNPFLASNIGQVTFGAPNGVYDLRIAQGARDTTIEIQCADLLQALNETASFLGARSTAPTTRIDGTPLQLADRYLNTADQLEYLYKSAGWVVNNLDGQLIATSQGASLIGAVMQDGSTGTIQQAINIGDNSLRQDLAAPATGGALLGYQHPGIGAVISNAKAKFGLMYVTPQDFDPSVGYGVTDAGAAVQKALNYLATVGGGELVYPPGNYKHITTPKLPVNLPNDLRISAYGANIIAVSGGRVFDVNKVADHDTLQNIEFCGANIDFTAMTGKNHVIAGTYVNGTIQTRVNFKNNTIRDIRGIGPAPDPTLVNHVICLYFQCAHPTSREATRGFVDGTRLINVKMVGGNAGYLVLGNSLASSDAPNISMDTVSVIDCEHKVTVAPEAFFASSSLHIGLDAIVKSVLVDNFYGENPGDNGIEINNVRSANIRLARIKNPQNVGYYIDNKNPDFDSTSQIITYDTCIGDHAGYGSRTFQIGPYVTDGSGGSEVHGKLGQVNYINCGTDFTAKGPTAGGFAINGGLSGQYLYDSISVENYKVTASYNTTLTSSQFPAAFSFRSSGPSRIRIDGVEWKLSGTIVQGGFIFRPRLVNLFGPDLMCSLSGVRGVLNFSGVTDTFRLISLELGKSTVFARNNKVVSSSPCTMLYLNVPDGLDSTHKAILSDSDWSGAGAVLATVTGGTDQLRFARVKDVQVAAPLGMVILGSGASPRTITNLVGYQQQVFVSGGSGVSIELDAGTGVFASTGQAVGGFMLSAGQSIRITYTTAPTVAVAHLGT